MTIAEALEARGEARGRLKAKIEIAIALLKNGFDNTFVADITKLEVSEVAELSKHIPQE